jgi:hypothetical protein
MLAAREEGNGGGVADEEQRCDKCLIGVTKEHNMLDFGFLIFGGFFQIHISREN